MIDFTKAPTGVMLSNAYTVMLKGCAEALDVYRSLCPARIGEFPLPQGLRTEFDGLDRYAHAGRSYFTGFSADQMTEVTVTVNLPDCKPEIVRCGSETSAPETYIGNTIHFTMNPGDKVIIKQNQYFGEHLCISCDPVYAIPSECEQLIEFKPGLYTDDNCEFIHTDSHGFPVIDSLPDHSTVYIHRGAVIHAALVLENAHDIKIIGGGVISTVEKCYGADLSFDTDPLYGALRKHAVPSIYIKTDSSHITVEGVTLNCEFRGVVVRNSDDILIDNVKIYTSCINADGVNMINVRRMMIRDCLVFSQDDAIAVFTNCDSIKFLADEECKHPVAHSSNIEVSGGMLITACRIFCVGGHSTGSLDPRNLLENFYAHDLRAICISSPQPYENHAMYWSGALRVISQTEQHIRNIRFENIIFEQRPDYCGKLIHLEVRSRKDASYTETNGYRIENVTIRNILVRNSHKTMLPCLISAQTDITEEDYCVDGVIISNVTFDDDMFSDSPDFITCRGPVKNLTIH